MKQILSEFDRDSLEMRIAAAEKRTQVQIVLAVIRRCDNYTEIPWKAFGIGSSIAGLAVFLFHLLLPDWITHTTVLLSVTVILTSGATLALFTVFFPRFARLFLSSHRAFTETKQYAESLFLAKELFATKGRNGILLLVGLFERKVILYPDKGLSSRLSEDDMQAIIDGMVLFLSRKEVRAAMEYGLEGLIRLLESASSANPFSNELSNKIIEEEGV